MYLLPHSSTYSCTPSPLTAAVVRTLSSWGSGNYRPSAPFLYEVASTLNNCHSGHYYYFIIIIQQYHTDRDNRARDRLLHSLTIIVSYGNRLLHLYRTDAHWLSDITATYGFDSLGCYTGCPRVYQQQLSLRTTKHK